MSRTIGEIRPGEIPVREFEQFSAFLDMPSPARRTTHKAQLVGRDGSKKDLPESLYLLLLTAVEQLSRGNGITIVPLNKELTTAEAANILNVSRPHVVKLLDEGEFRYHKVGTHRRIALADLLAYRDHRDEEFDEAMRELHLVSEELGIPE